MGRVQELYQHRALLQILVIRELKARYRGTVLGFLWSFVNPLVLMTIYVLVFSVYLRVEMKNYPAFLMCGVFAWNWFSMGINEATSSIISNGGLIKKVYLPTEIIPLVYITSNTVHYLLTLPIQFAFLIFFRIDLSLSLGILPIIVLLQLVFMYGLALLFSSLAVQFRDLLHIVPNMLMVWFFLTPIFYSNAMVPEKYRPIMHLNPMAHLIGSYQDLFYWGRTPSMVSLMILFVIAVALLFASLALFETQKDLFAEEV